MLPLMDKTLQEKLPPLYATDGKATKMIYARYYHPEIDWEWFAMEYSPLQRLFFGLVDGDENELGYFSLDELEACGVQRDFTFVPKEYKQGDSYERVT